MLPNIKSILAGFTPAPVPLVPSVQATAAAVEAQVSLKHKELSQGKTGAQVERLRAELETAQLALDHAEQAEGECEVDGRDATGATDARRQAEDRVRTVKAALSVAMAKHQAAQRALTDAKRAAEMEVEAAARARVLALGPRFEEVSALVRQLAMDTARELEALRVIGGGEKYSYSVNEIRMQFDLFLGLAKHPLTSNAYVSPAFMKYRSWRECVEAICGERQHGK